MAEGKKIIVNVTVDAKTLGLDLRKLDLKNGDVVVVHTTRELSQDAAIKVQSKIQSVIATILPPSVQVGLVVLAPGMAFEHLTERSLAAVGLQRIPPSGLSPGEMHRLGIEPVKEPVCTGELDEGIPDTGEDGSVG